MNMLITLAAMLVHSAAPISFVSILHAAITLLLTYCLESAPQNTTHSRINARTAIHAHIYLLSFPRTHERTYIGYIIAYSTRFYIFIILAVVSQEHGRSPKGYKAILYYGN